jgi:hypothetical protein
MQQNLTDQVGNKKMEDDLLQNDIDQKQQLINENPKPFERLFHNAPARMLDFFVLFKNYDYTEAEIARRTNLTPKTVSKELENLVNEEIVKLTRKIGRSNMYTLSDSTQVRGLVQFIEDRVKTGYEYISTNA